MKKILIAMLLVFVLVAACAPVEKAPEAEKKAPVTPKVEVKEEAKEIKPVEPKPPEPAPEVKAEPAEPKDVDIEQACKNLLSIEEFAKICDMDVSRMTGTVKETEYTCWVTFVDRMERKYTAGFTTVDWIKTDEANSEFQRGIDMRRKDAETDVGEKNYKYSEIERENIVWVRGSFLTRIGASTDLCSKEQLLELAKLADSRMH